MTEATKIDWHKPIEARLHLKEGWHPARVVSDHVGTGNYMGVLVDLDGSEYFMNLHRENPNGFMPQVRNKQERLTGTVVFFEGGNKAIFTKFYKIEDERLRGEKAYTQAYLARVVARVPIDVAMEV